MNYLCAEGTINYKCYDTLKKLLLENDEFRLKIIKGISEKKIKGFDKELW